MGMLILIELPDGRERGWDKLGTIVDLS